MTIPCTTTIPTVATTPTLNCTIVALLKSTPSPKTTTSQQNSAINHAIANTAPTTTANHHTTPQIEKEKKKLPKNQMPNRVVDPLPSLSPPNPPPSTSSPSPSPYPRTSQATTPAKPQISDNVEAKLVPVNAQRCRRTQCSSSFNLPGRCLVGVLGGGFVVVVGSLLMEGGGGVAAAEIERVRVRTSKRERGGRGSE